MASLADVRAEAEMNELLEVPVSIIHQGTCVAKMCVTIDLVLNTASNVHYSTCQEAVQDLLNNKVTSSPDAMKLHADECRLVLCSKGGHQKILRGDEPLKNYCRPLAVEESTLMVVDHLTDPSTLKCNMNMVSMKQSGTAT